MTPRSKQFNDRPVNIACQPCGGRGLRVIASGGHTPAREHGWVIAPDGQVLLDKTKCRGISHVVAVQNSLVRRESAQELVLWTMPSNQRLCGNPGAGTGAQRKRSHLGAPPVGLAKIARPDTNDLGQVGYLSRWQVTAIESPHDLSQAERRNALFL